MEARYLIFAMVLVVAACGLSPKEVPVLHREKPTDRSLLQRCPPSSAAKLDPEKSLDYNAPLIIQAEQEHQECIARHNRLIEWFEP